MKKLFAEIKKSKAVCSYFYRFALKEKPYYALLILFNILFLSLCPVINMLLPKYIVAELTGDKDKTKLIILAAILVGGNFIVKGLTTILSEMRQIQEDSLARELDLMLSEKAMKLEYELTETEEGLSARQKAETGMSWYSGGIRGMSECIVKLGTSLLVIFSVTGIVFTVSPLILIMSVLAVSVNAFCTSRINAASQEVFEKTPAINKLYTYIYTKINGREYAKELRLYDAIPLVEKKAVENAKELNKMDNECAGKQLRWGSIGSIASAVGYGISYGWLGLAVLKGNISLADFVMCISAIEVFTNDCLISFITNAQQLMMKSNFMSAFIAYMTLADEESTGNESIDDKAFEGIVFDHVSFKYPGTDNWILKDINLQIKKGESLSLVGVNGAGKSTLVKLITRLYDVTEGEIRICGKNIRNYSYEEYVKLLAVVFQDFKLFGYTIEENVSFGSKDPGKRAAAVPEDIYEMSGTAEWINSLKDKAKTLLYKEYDENGVEPSGGQAQKLAIARALYRDAPVVILDEPTAALDPLAEYEVYKKFDNLVNGKTAVYISHRLSSCRFCDHIAVIADKTIKEYGTHEELVGKDGGVYAGMFAEQAQYYIDVQT